MTDFLNTPATLTQQILQRDGYPLHYWLSGPAERPLLVSMHGVTMDHRMFNAQVEALVADYRVLVWDARGHNQSQPKGSGFSLTQCAQDMLAILNELDVSQAILCGQSLGGYIAQHIYRHAPERVQAMIVIGLTPIAKAYSRWEIWALKALLPLLRLWPHNHSTQTIARSTTLLPDVQACALQATRQVNKADFAVIWQAVTLAVDEEGNPTFRIDVPLLLMHGDKDRAGTIRRDMPLWAKWEKEVTYQVIPNAGHKANQDNPEFTNQLIQTFLLDLKRRFHVRTNQ